MKAEDRLNNIIHHSERKAEHINLNTSDIKFIDKDAVRGVRTIQAIGFEEASTKLYIDIFTEFQESVLMVLDQKLLAWIMVQVLNRNEFDASIMGSKKALSYLSDYPNFIFNYIKRLMRRYRVTSAKTALEYEMHIHCVR